MTVPRISVVIPTYNRPAFIKRCLEALKRQTLAPNSFEVIVVDDGNAPATRAAVELMSAQAAFPIRYHAMPRRSGPAAARNVGWRAAAAEVIAFTDDDCIPDPDWLTAGQRAFECDIKAATGKTVVPVPEPPTDYQRNTAHLATAQFVTANCFCRRSVLERIGGFDERFTMAWREDSDLHFHLMEEGVKIERLQDAVVVHPVRPAPWGVSLKEQKKSQFNALLYKKHPRLYRQHIQPGAPWHYYVMLMFLLTALAGLLGGRWPLAAFALSAWLTLTGNFALQRLRRNSRSAAHVWEMVATSLAIPPLSVFWRLYGAYKYRVWFW